MANEVVERKFTTALSEWTNTITQLVESDYTACGVTFDEYSKKCAMAAMTSIYQLVKSSGKDIKSIDTSNLREIVGQCASLKLNANAMPRECYFQMRNKKVGNEWVSSIEMGIEGNGNDAILRNFGVDVERPYPAWVVKQGDKFEYGKHRGIENEPPIWEETGQSDKVDKVVYPIRLKDGTVQYLIAERESVRVNLLAHVRQNMMNETFGVCKDRYHATEAQLSEIKAKKKEIIDELRKCETVDDMLACEVARPYISAAWLDTPESMIERKLKNNITKKFPKDYDAMARNASMQMDEVYQVSQAEIEDNANTVDFIEPVIDVESED